MARPERKDVDYFPFFVKDGRTLFILESKYGCKGTGFFTNVMRFLCMQPDHHFCIQEPADHLYFFSKMHCDQTEALDMIDLMTKTGKLHRDLWLNCKVLVSQDLIFSLTDAYRNRKNQIVTMEEILVYYAGKKQAPVVSSAGNPPESEIKGQSSEENAQSKVKESKVKETTLSQQEIPLDPVKEEKPPEKPVEPKKEIPFKEMIDLWNSACKKNKVLQITENRKKHIRNRWLEKPDLEYWKKVFSIIWKSEFCRGKNDRGWIANFDFAMRPDTHVKATEGIYDNAPGTVTEEDKAITELKRLAQLCWYKCFGNCRPVKEQCEYCKDKKEELKNNNPPVDGSDESED